MNGGGFSGWPMSFVSATRNIPAVLSSRSRYGCDNGVIFRIGKPCRRKPLANFKINSKFLYAEYPARALRPVSREAAKVTTTLL